MSESEYKKKLVIAEAERDHHKKWSNNYEQALNDAQQNIKQKAAKIQELQDIINVMADVNAFTYGTTREIEIQTAIDLIKAASGTLGVEDVD